MITTSRREQQTSYRRRRQLIQTRKRDNYHYRLVANQSFRRANTFYADVN